MIEDELSAKCRECNDAISLEDEICVNCLDRATKLLLINSDKLLYKIHQQKIQAAIEILKNVMSGHTQIEPNIWASALWGILVCAYKISGHSYEEFIEECDELKCYYKHWFDS